MSLLTNNQTSATSASKTSQLMGVKRRVTAASVNDSIKMSKQRRLMTELMQETNGSQFWNMNAANNFVNTKTQDVNASPTELTNDGDIVQNAGG